jgi:hypothetical protein
MHLPFWPLVASHAPSGRGLVSIGWDFGGFFVVAWASTIVPSGSLKPATSPPTATPIANVRTDMSASILRM